MLPARQLGAVIMTVLFLVALFVVAWGRGWIPGSPTGARTASIAIVDIEVVAKQLGADAAVERQIKDAETALNAQLGTLQTSLRKQFEDKSKELLAPSANAAAAKQQLAECEKALNQQLLQAQQTARSKFAVYRSSLFQNFRSEIVPVAKKIAEQHGCGVVLTKNDAVLLTFDESRDITNAVVEEMRKKRPAPAVARAEQPSSLR
jgi:Skp family chaperone for outer membrane proteins